MNRTSCLFTFLFIFLLPYLCLVVCFVPQGKAGARPASRAPKKPAGEFRVAAYLPDYRVGALDPAVLSTVTDLIFFSLEPTPDGGIDSARLTPAIAANLQDFKAHHALRLWAAFGGWERSAGFAPMTTDAAKRRRFVQGLTQFCLTHHLDGADFDWEHPANASEEAGYTALLVETHTAFAPHGLRLSVTVAPWQKLDPAAVTAVDAVNLMSYDHEGRHSTFAQAQTDVAGLLQQGVPSPKLCLGLPFYGQASQNPTPPWPMPTSFPSTTPRPLWMKSPASTSTAFRPFSRRLAGRAISISAVSWSGNSARTRRAMTRC